MTAPLYSCPCLAPAYPVMPLISPASRGFARPAQPGRAFFFGQRLVHVASLFFLPFSHHANGYEKFAKVRNGR